MQFAVEIPADDHAAGEELLSRVAQWHTPPGRQYQTAEVEDLDHPAVAGCARAFFIRMTPGARVHRHRDPPGVVDHYDTDHIVVTTNDRSVICWSENGVDKSVHLDLGKRYRILDRGVLHWAENNGDTDRIHLLIEYPKQISSRRRA